MAEPTLLKMNGIVKTFPGVKALDHVNLQVEKGEVHALMGENGAGKSTLIKVLTGAYQKDEGTVTFDEKEVNFKSPMAAQLGGISTIYQEVSLIPYLSVTENIFMGREPTNSFGKINWKAAHKEAMDVLEGMGIRIDVKQPVQDLSAAIQQMVSIARAISMKAKLVVMDEPTSSLNEEEVQVLFNVIRQLKKQGVSIIYVSHKLDEIYTISNRISVLRDGAYVGTWNTSDLPQLELIAKMIGKSEEEVAELNKYKEESSAQDATMIKLDNVSSGEKVKDLTFSIKRGEVLGLAGLLGSGRTETANVMFGVDKANKGIIEFSDEKIEIKSPRDAMKIGIGYCSENRKTEGILPNMSVRENLTIASLKKVSKLGFISKKKQLETVNAYIKRFGIKTPSPEQKIKNLSGGNQQKVLLARWLATNPDLLILDEPTRGIDVGAKGEIHQLISELAKEGLSILMISSEFEELIQNTDRIIVLKDGRQVGELTGEDRNEDAIMRTIAQKKQIEKVDPKEEVSV